MLMFVLSAIATIFPATMGPEANPLQTPEVIKPEWYFYVSFRWLKLFSATFAILSSGLIVMSMILWPWIDAFLRKRTRVAGNQHLHRHRRRLPARRADRSGKPSCPTN